MRSIRPQILTVASLLFGGAPLVFGLIRAVTAGDTQLIGMAGASLLGAAVAALIARRRKPRMGIAAEALVTLSSRRSPQRAPRMRWVLAPPLASGP